MYSLVLMRNQPAEEERYDKQLNTDFKYFRLTSLVSTQAVVTGQSTWSLGEGM